MQGWLAVNGFMNSPKFEEIYSCLVNSAKRNHSELKICRSDRIASQVYLNCIPSPLPDYVIFWDKDTYLARSLELAGFPVFNSARAIALCDSKAKTYLVLKENHIRTLKTIISPITFESIGYTEDQFVQEAGESLGWPMVIKEEYGSMGMQVYLANNLREAKSIIQKLSFKRFLMQEYLACSSGSDFRVNVVNQKVICSIHRFSVNGDFRSNLTLGGKMEPYQADQETADLALSACAAMGLDYAGVDIMKDEEGHPVITEVNSNPHFKTTYDCTGIDMSDLILKHVLAQVSRK